MEYNDVFDLGYLLAQHLKGELSPAEQARLDNWLAESEANRAQFTRLVDQEKLKADYAAYGESDYHKAWQRIAAETGFELSPAKSNGFYKVAAAAVVLLMLSFGGYFILHKDKPAQQVAVVIKPGGNKAILTLANGKQVVLTGAKNGQIASESQSVINKTGDGQVAYAGAGAGAELVYNTMTTPVQGKYTVVLADGSKVTLNALSSLKYPVAFNGNERKVELTGEAYFEVAHNKAKPFRVVSKGQTVEVLGTHFDINTYADEPVVKTTLLEGSVKVSIGQNQKVIKPGEQAVLADNALTVNKVDAGQSVAWIRGDFDFEGTQLKAIMRQVSRWYDVEVVYQGKIENTEFGGSISRAKNINEVLHVLEMTNGVHFKIEGRRVTVMP